MALVNAGLGMAAGRSPSFLANLAGGAQQGVKSLGDIAKSKQDLEDKNDSIRARNQQIDDSESAIKRNAMSFSKSMFDSDRTLKLTTAKELAAMEHQQHQDSHQDARDADSHALAAQRLSEGVLDLTEKKRQAATAGMAPIPEDVAQKLGVPPRTYGRIENGVWVAHPEWGMAPDDTWKVQDTSRRNADDTSTIKETKRVSKTGQVADLIPYAEPPPKPKNLTFPNKPVELGKDKDGKPIWFQRGDDGHFYPAGT
jgi:hypothetical protein